MNKIGILYHPLNKSARDLADYLQSLVTRQGKTGWLCSVLEESSAIEQLDGTGLLLSIGGDGTILRVAQVAIIGNIPIIGVNMGNLGFMTELSADEVESALTKIFDGKGWVDNRSMLEAELSGRNQTQVCYHALNDVVLARGKIIRIISVEVNIDGEYFATYRADGAVCSTATGSTGYSLSAGGPILHPSAHELVLTPLLSHLSPSYSLVLPENACVRLTVKALATSTLSIDGHTNLELDDEAVVTIRKSKNITRFLRLRDKYSFYSTLERKLKGKQRK